MTPAPHLILAACLVLGACEAAPTVEELRTTDAAACSGAGFAPGSDAHGLCLLLQGDQSPARGGGAAPELSRGRCA
ncbi:MAG: hypothetical protein R3C69_07645 [Geminicoccaceae bacterium]